MANTTSFVSTDRQGHFQLGHYCHITRTISISEDTARPAKVGSYDHRETVDVEKSIITVVSFSSTDPKRDAQKAEQVFALVSHHSASTSGPGTLATLTLNS